MNHAAASSGKDLYNLLSALHDTQERHRQLQENSPHGIWTLDASGTIKSTNPRAAEMLGYTPAEMNGHPAVDFAFETDRAELARELAQRCQQPVAPREFRLSRKDGTALWVSLSSFGASAASDKPRELVLSLTDLTEIKRAQEQLRKSNEELDLRVWNRTSKLQNAYDLLASESEERRLLSEELSVERDRLQASNRRIAEILASIAEGYTAIDREYRVTAANGIAEQMHRLSPAQLIGRYLWEVFPNVLSSEFFRQYQVAFTENRPVHFEAYSAQDDKWYEVHAYPQPAGMDIYFHDITSRRRTENEIKQLYHDIEERAGDIESERARWRAALASIPDEVWVCDPKGRISLLNSPALAEWGIAEFQNKSLDEILQELETLNLDGQPRPAQDAPLLRSLKGEIVRGEELVRHRPTGKLRYRQFTSAPIREHTGAITGAIAIVRDITEQKQYQVERENAERALRETEERFRMVLENSLDVAYRRNLKTDRYDYLSPVISSLTGFTVDEFSALAYEDVIARIHRDDVAYVQSEVSRTLGDASTAAVEYRLRGKDGRYVWVADNFRVLRDEFGRPIYRVGIFRDVTASKLAEQEIQRLYAEQESRATQLEIANRELESFTYSVSHDLRTPLAGIASFSGLLQHEFGGALPPAAQRYLEMVRANALAMSDLVDALLRLSRLTRQPITRQDVDMTELVNQVIAGLEQEIGSRQIEFTVQALPVVRGDPVLLKQVWSNLISNAVKFTRPRDHAIITMGCEKCEDAERAFFVRDNGIGFSTDASDKLFGVFQRLHSDEEYEGSGVGLAIVERIVRRHGGHVWAEGEDGRGATFYFALGG